MSAHDALCPVTAYPKRVRQNCECELIARVMARDEIECPHLLEAAALAAQVIDTAALRASVIALRPDESGRISKGLVIAMIDGDVS